MALSDADAAVIGSVLTAVTGPLGFRVFRDARRAKRKVVEEVRGLLDSQYRSEITHLRSELAEEKAQNADLINRLLNRGDSK